MANTVRTESDLLTNLFQDGQSAGSISEQDMRDLIVSAMLKMDALGAATGGWRDLRASLVGTASGPAAPTLTAFGPTGKGKQLAFGVGDSVYVSLHMDHDVKPGSTVYPHVHWTTNGTSTATVKWEMSITEAAGHNTANFPADTVTTVEEAAAGTAWRHMVTEHPTGYAAPEPDTLIIITLSRITNGGTDNGDTVFGLYVDFHYEADRVATKNRTPDFYA